MSEPSLRPEYDALILIDEGDAPIPLGEVVDRFRLTPEELNDEIRTGRLEVISEPMRSLPQRPPLAGTNGAAHRFYVLTSSLAEWLANDEVPWERRSRLGRAMQ